MEKRLVAFVETLKRWGSFERYLDRVGEKLHRLRLPNTFLVKVVALDSHEMPI